MEEVTLSSPSLADILKIIEGMSAKNYSLLIFRGHADASWPLVPSLYRLEMKENPVLFALMGGETPYEERFDKAEHQLIERFFAEGMPYLPPIERTFTNDRVVAQHFGVPTRLLDWSRDPFVALFFALEKWQSSSDSCLIVMTSERSAIYADGKAVEAANRYHLIEPPAIDRRIPAQKSVLTFHPYGVSNLPFVPIDERERIDHMARCEVNAPTSSMKVIIPYTHKKRMFMALQGLGFDRRTLFPGLDGVGAYINSMASSQDWW